MRFTLTMRSRFHSWIIALRILKLSLTSSGIGVWPTPFIPPFRNARKMMSLAMVKGDPPSTAHQQHENRRDDDHRHHRVAYPRPSDQADRIENHTPTSGLTNWALPAAARLMPVAAATLLMVSAVPGAANTWVAAAPLLMTVTS